MAGLVTVWETVIKPILEIAALIYAVITSLPKSPTYEGGAKITSCDPTIPRALIYGRHKYAGNIIWQDFSSDKKTMYLFVAFGAGPPDGTGIEGYEDIRIDDVPIGDIDDASVTKYYGTSNQSVDARCAGGAAEVGSLRYIAYLALTLPVTDNNKNRLPNVTAIIRGRRVRAWGGYGWVKNLFTPNQADVEMDTSGFAAMGLAAISRSTSQYWHGGASLLAVCPDGASGQGARTTSVNIDNPSRVHTVCVRLKGSGTVQIGISERDAADAEIGITWSDPVTLTSTWRWYEISRTFGAMAAKLRGIVATAGAEACTFYADGWMAYEGSGVRVWMPGGESSGWSDNPYWCELDLLKDDLNGGGYIDDQLDLDSFNEAAQVCDVLVDGEPRFSLNVVIDWKEPLLDVMDKLRQNHRGFYYLRQGKYAAGILKVGTSLQSLEVGRPGGIIRGSMQVQEPGADELPDIVRCWYTDPDQGWSRQYAEHRGPNAEIPHPDILEIQLIGTTSRKQASRLAKEHYRLRHECGRRGAFKGTIALADRTPGDPVDITWDKFPTIWTRKMVWIDTIKTYDNHEIEMTFQEYADIFDDAEASGEPGGTYNPLPNPWAAPGDPSGLSAEEVRTLNKDKTWNLHWDVFWTAPASVYVERYRVLLSYDDGATYAEAGYTQDTTIRIGPLAPKDAAGATINYKIKIQAVNSAEGHNLMSPGVITGTLNLTGDTTAPTDPTIAPSVVAGIKQLTVICNVTGDVDVAAIKIRRQSAPAEYDAANKRYIVPVTPNWGEWINVADVATSAGALVSWVDSGASAINQCYRYSYLVEDGSGNQSGWSPESEARVPAAVEEQDLGDVLSSRLARVQVRQAIQQCKVNPSTNLPEFLSPGTGRAVNLDCLIYSADQCTGGTAIESSHYSNYTPDKAFDDLYPDDPYASSWISDDLYQSKIGYHFPVPKTIREIRINQRRWVNIIPPEPEYEFICLPVSAITVEYSQDGVQWISVGAYQVSLLDKIWSTIKLAERITAPYWRLVGNNTDRRWGVWEIEMEEAIGAPFVGAIADGFDDVNGARDWLVSVTDSIADAWTGLPKPAYILSLTRSGTVATAVCYEAHGFLPGMEVIIAGVTTPGWNGTYVVTGVPQTDRFTFTVPDTLTTPADFIDHAEARHVIFLYIDRDPVTTLLSFGHTLFPPNDDPARPPAVEDQHWFAPSKYVMERYDGAAWVPVQRLFVGECTVDINGYVGSIVCYAPLARYDSGWFDVVINQHYPNTHNIGSMPLEYEILAQNSEGIIARARYIDSDGTKFCGVSLAEITRKSAKLTTLATLDHTAGYTKTATKLRIIIRRGY